MPVTVSSTPAAATAATPLAPRMRTAAAGPVLGPIGSCPTVNITIRSAIESNTEMFTPIACSINQPARPRSSSWTISACRCARD